MGYRRARKGTNRRRNLRDKRKAARRGREVPEIECEFYAYSRDEWTLALNNVPDVAGDEALSLLAHMLPPIRCLTRQVLRADSCIASTKIVIGLAQALGLSAEPRSIVGEVFNPVMGQWLVANERPWSRDEQIALAAAGGRCLVVGYDDHPDAEKDDGRWNGHLVAVVEDRVLVDLTFDQFNRPAKGIPVDGPLFAPWRPGLGTARIRDDGVLLRFMPGGSNEYETAPDWKRRYIIRVNGREHVASAAGSGDRLAGGGGET